MHPSISKTQNLDKHGGTVSGDGNGIMNEFNLDLSPLELKCVTKFFNNFVIVSESSLVEHIDIVLFLRALPERITKDNINKIKLFAIFCIKFHEYIIPNIKALF